MATNSTTIRPREAISRIISHICLSTAVSATERRMADSSSLAVGARLERDMTCSPLISPRWTPVPFGAMRAS